MIETTLADGSKITYEAKQIQQEGNIYIIKNPESISGKIITESYLKLLNEEKNLKDIDVIFSINQIIYSVKL